MDPVTRDAANSNDNGSRPYSVEKSKEEGGEEEDGETQTLLQAPMVANGGITKKGQRISKRRVQWNDRKGNKLVETFEFQPSDSSDSEDDSSSLGGWSLMYTIASCIHLCCCC